MYAVGFIFVVLGRSESSRNRPPGGPARLAGPGLASGDLPALGGGLRREQIGVTAFAALATLIGPALGVIEPAFGSIAHRLTEHPGSAIFSSAVLAG